MDEKNPKSKSVAELLKLHPELVLQPNNKILCTLTNHEMAPQFAAIHGHVNGKKFKKAMEWYCYDYNQYMPFVVPHKGDKKKLYCTLTKQTLNKIPDEVKKHWEGKRFQKLKEEKEKAPKVSKPVKKIEIAKDISDDEEDCWVPDFPLDDSDVEEDKEGILEESGDEEISNYEEEEEEEEVILKSSTKKLSNSENHDKKKGGKRSREDDIDGEEVIIKKSKPVSKKNDREKHKSK